MGTAASQVLMVLQQCSSLSAGSACMKRASGICVHGPVPHTGCIATFCVCDNVSCVLTELFGSVDVYNKQRTHQHTHRTD